MEGQTTSDRLTTVLFITKIGKNLKDSEKSAGLGAAQGDLQEAWAWALGALEIPWGLGGALAAGAQQGPGEPTERGACQVCQRVGPPPGVNESARVEAPCK